MIESEESEIEKYVLGFAFDNSLSEVLLVKKEFGPEFNIGKLNGIGGKVEHGEEFDTAMYREGLEEAGLSGAHWINFGLFHGRVGSGGTEFEIGLYKTVLSSVFDAKDFNDVGERNYWRLIKDVVNPKIYNLFAQNVPTMVCHARNGAGFLEIIDYA